MMQGGPTLNHVQRLLLNCARASSQSATKRDPHNGSDKEP